MEERSYAATQRLWTRVLLAPALSDWVVLGYFVTVLTGLAVADPSPERTHYLGFVGTVSAIFISLVLFFRLRLDSRGEDGGSVRRPFLVGYRLLALPAFLIVYLELRQILPLINQATYDELLYRLDVRLLGFEPTVVIEKLSTRRVVEWFAFFYYLYFYVIGLYVFGIVLFDRHPCRPAYFATGLMLVLGIGQFVYTLVPGYGPYHHLAHAYASDLEGGLFYDLVWRAVSAEGPLRDIFPSLHTAVPSFLTMFAWRHYRKVAPLSTFVTLNIIAATMVLRWHWAVDCMAGLLLATGVFLLSPRLVDGYQRLRAREGLPADVWW